MAHKTLTISEDAYHELTKMKREHESFTDVILRLTSEKGRAKSLLEYLDRAGKSEELARSIESVAERTRKARLRKVVLS